MDGYVSVKKVGFQVEQEMIKPDILRICQRIAFDE